MTRYLITSALPYINGIKHLGNLVGSMLPADAYARYLRLRGHEVLYICATDEHGTPAELAAAAAGEPVESFCERMYSVQKGLGERFGLKFDHFGRSSSPQNHELTQHMANKLADAGLIREVMTKQVYSLTDQRYLPDRYVEGTCPNCGFDKARGDQCENCTKQLDPTDLINPRSAVSGSTDLEVRETKHLYLCQSQMREKLRTWIEAHADWPTLTRSIALKWLNDNDGLQDRGITRDLQWGIPVLRNGETWSGMEGKVFYVWFDAPIEYIAATKEWADATGQPWESWWRTDKGADDVHYVQFMAKDNIPFHTLGFPATLMGSGEPWKLVDYIKGFNWLTYEGGKFSTSQGRGVFMDQALEIMPSDYWRWWLLSNAPESSDSNFTWESFQNCINKDLSDVLGNFVSRVTKFCHSKFGDTIPSGGTIGEAEHKLATALQERLVSYAQAMENIEIRKAASELRALWTVGNEYLQEAAPWATFKESPEKAAMQIRVAFNLIYLYAVVSSPFIPDTCDAILTALQIDGFKKWDGSQEWPDNNQLLTALAEGHAFSVPENLFTKLDDATRESLEERFGGYS